MSIQKDNNAVLVRMRPPKPLPVWAPLEQLAGVNPCDYMFMGHPRSPVSAPICQYKHIHTRRYLNISADGRCWRYSDSRFHPVPTAEAIAHATQ